MSYRPLPEYGGTDPLPTWRRFTIVLNDIFDALWTAAATMVGKVAGSITTDDDGKALLVGDLSDEELPAEVAVYGTDGEGERGYMLLSDLVAEGNLGTGDVTGPETVTADGNIAVYDGTTGKLLKDGGQTIASLIAASLTRKIFLCRASLYGSGEAVENVHVELQISKSATFASVEYDLDTETSQTNWRVFDGTEWVAFPAGGSPSVFEAAAYIGLAITDSDVRYARWRVVADSVAGDWVGEVL
jgi:hypothetical protein